MCSPGAAFASGFFLPAHRVCQKSQRYADKQCDRTGCGGGRCRFSQAVDGHLHLRASGQAAGGLFDRVCFLTEAASSGTERIFLQGTADFPLEKSFHVRSHSQVLDLMEELHKSLDAFAHVQDAQRCELFRLYNPFADRPGKGAARVASQPLAGSGAKRWPELVSRLSVRSDLSACLLRTWLAGWSGASAFCCFL
jgi:hypothetical protein